MNKKVIITLVTILIAIIGSIIAISFGSKVIPISIVIESFINFDDTSIDMQLIRNIRLPRVIATFFVGGLLATSGAIMQGVTRNPVAEPTLMGISQGATLAVAISSSTALGTISTNLSAFLGALISGLLVIVFSMKNARNLNISRLLLAGTALSTLFISLATVISLLTGQSQNLAFWVSGGFRTVTWTSIKFLIPIAVATVLYSLVLATKINILALGEDVSIGLGENPVKIRFASLMLIIPMTSISVATAGNIAFVGLIVPYIVKAIFGQDFKIIIPISFLVGATLLVWSDMLARLVNQPYETPIGLFTSLIGVPLFIYMIRKENS